MRKESHHRYADSLERMLEDAVLDPGIRPQPRREDEGISCVLLTGASGFLGLSVLERLLESTTFDVICIVRDKAGVCAKTRLGQKLVERGLDQRRFRARIEVIAGDITSPRMGLDDRTYARIADKAGVIYHCAARVDWVRPYSQLAAMNVGGVREMIRLACHGKTKRLIFVSTAAVCYSRTGPTQVDEMTDMLPFIEGMPLGYARSKCIAETLLRHASDRGVPVTILRPSLISGDSRTGEGSPADIIVALIQACVLTGEAIDADWLLDCVAVDFVAHAMVTIPQENSCWQIVHLMHGKPRHWRELILWINLHGYPVSLVENRVWVRHLFKEKLAADTMLYAQRRFFTGAGDEGSPYETYLAGWQARISGSGSRQLLAACRLQEPPLDSRLLHNYFRSYRQAGVLPPLPVDRPRKLTLATLSADRWLRPDGQPLLSARTMRDEAGIETGDGLLSELVSARCEGVVGLRKVHLTRVKDSSDNIPDKAILKVKVSDSIQLELTSILAGLCRPELGRLFRVYGDVPGLTASHVRELAVYEQASPLMRQYMPECYGILRNRDSGYYALLIEYLPEAGIWKEGYTHGGHRSDESLVLQGLAHIHAEGFSAVDQAGNSRALLPFPDTDRMLGMMPLWSELADFAADWFEPWCGPEIRVIQRRVLASLPSWWPQLSALPQTLIHNDFNPRNFVLRETGGEWRLCAYDWELAARGVPQHDLAEYLCFSWCDAYGAEDFHRTMDTSRRLLSSISGREIKEQEWMQGFALSLRYLLINRLALYTLMHRFRPLAFLPKVMHNWQRLHAWADPEMLCRAITPDEISNRASLFERPSRVAYVYAYRGDADRAFEWLQKSVAEEEGGFNPMNPLLQPLHNDPRWLPFLESIGRSPEQLAAIEFEVKLPAQ